MEFNIALLPGDYIGPEVIAEAVKVMDAVGEQFGHIFRWREDAIGGASIDIYGEPLRQETVELCRQCDAILFGAAGGPKWDNPESRNPADTALPDLRKCLDLFANIRPVRVLPTLVGASSLKPEIVGGVDLIILRELTGGLYFGEPKGITRIPGGKKAVDTLAYTEAEIERVLRAGFELARSRSKCYPWIRRMYWRHHSSGDRLRPGYPRSILTSDLIICTWMPACRSAFPNLWTTVLGSNGQPSGVGKNEVVALLSESHPPLPFRPRSDLRSSLIVSSSSCKLPT